MLPYYAYDDQETPAHNLIRASVWIAENVVREECKRLNLMLVRAQQEFPDPSEGVVRDGLYGQLIVHAVAAWADEELLQQRNGNYEAALSMLRKWRRRWDETTGADDADPGHERALLEWLQMKVRKYP